MIGNYGVPSKELDEYGMLKFYESPNIHIAGMLVSDYSHKHHHWNAETSLASWLQEEGVPGLYNIDTRALTRKLREKGCMKGKIVIDKDVPLVDINMSNLVEIVSTNEVTTYNKEGDVHIVAVDCGIKFNIVREMVQRGAKVTVVPFDYDFNSIECDGIFLSNGPGDPAMCERTISHLEKAIEGDKPIFGICLGNQLLSRAAGFNTYKLQYGNRGQNQPVMDMITRRVYITPQNHGFAVDSNNPPMNWQPLFINTNDGSNEGVMHTSKPFFSVQFHPEARCGPQDTSFLFDKFLTASREFRDDEFVKHPIRSDIPQAPKKVLMMGSGGLSIGQAGEFDYSGSQALKAYKDAGVETVLVNPNIATIQTARGLADKVYYSPLSTEYMKRIIEREKPDALSLSFGGQTALNCGVDLYQEGYLQSQGVKVLGTSVESIMMTEDRELFCNKLNEIGEPIIPSFPTYTVEEAKEAAKKLNYPVILRAAYSLGGLGSGFAHNDEELEELASKAFATSPQVLVEKDLRGWREVEYEVVRDTYDNCITVCNMENFDPLGIHTGESIVVAPSQTLTNDEYHMLRTSSMRIVRALGIVGECNVQYALDSHSQNYAVIECNPRLSRSSALASKATGYPLALIAAKIGLGAELPTLANAVTQNTTACFEPSLDYIVTKVPRWDMTKFWRVSPLIGSAMKSVGEVMAIGRNFEESLQKALRMVDDGNAGFEQNKNLLEDGADLEDELVRPTWRRIHVLAKVMYDGTYTVDELYDLTRIDKWFLYKLENIVNTSRDLDGLSNLDELRSNKKMLKRAKSQGFSDKQIAARIGSDVNELDVRVVRKELEIIPVVKQIDTLAAEFPAWTNYLYVTYNGNEDDIEFDQNGTVVLGSGVYRIGSSVEFDYCSVECIRALREMKKSTVMINYNPETVSTDYDESERLYFEELSLERVLDIYEKEKATGVIVSVGGQAPNNIAKKMHDYGINVMGTHPYKIDSCEDRDQFSSMLDSIGVNQPEWTSLKAMDDAKLFAEKVGYPVLVRPSYVLSGAAMNVAHTPQELEDFLKQADDISDEYPVVMTKFYHGALEVDVDCVADNGKIVAWAVSEHVEHAGVHSGDATLVLPAHTLSQEAQDDIMVDVKKIAKALEISGPFNTQFLWTPEWKGVIETNLRASRSAPFVSKVLDVPFIKLATQIMCGVNVEEQEGCKKIPSHVGVKSPQFSWKRLLGADPVLDVEMSSTGEVACFGDSVNEAFLKSIVSAGFVLPKKGDSVYVTSNADTTQDEFQMIKDMYEIGFNIVTGDQHTHEKLSEAGVPQELEKNEHAPLRSRSVSLMMDLSNNDPEKYDLRRTTTDFAIPLLTNARQMRLFVDAMQENPDLKPKHYDEYCPP